MENCNKCKKEIDLDSDSYYPYANNIEDDELNPHELADTPFCDDCANEILNCEECKKEQTEYNVRFCTNHY